MVSVTRKFTFEAAHRLPEHKGGCARIHGHSYKLEVTIVGEMDDETGMIVDFGDIKKYLKGWIDDNLDHRLILSSKKDESLINAVEKVLPSMKVYVLPFEPTVENMAKYLLNDVFQTLVGDKLEVFKVKLWETENCFAEAIKEGYVNAGCKCS